MPPRSAPQDRPTPPRWRRPGRPSRWAWPRSRSCRRTAPGKGQPEAERGATAPDAGHRARAAQELRQLPRDRQAEAGAAELARGGRVDLREALEQLLQPVAGDTGAAVSHGADDAAR